MVLPAGLRHHPGRDGHDQHPVADDLDLNFNLDVVVEHPQAEALRLRFLLLDVVDHDRHQEALAQLGLEGLGQRQPEATPLNPGTGQAGHNVTLPSTKPTTKKKPSKAKKPTATPPPPVTKSGVPTPANPTFSYALPGAAPIGVPNFFIDSFQIPPFLLPIYQAAGIQYDVPWQVLAAINEIETDYGRNLSVSTAGAVGWMQFLPSTWKRYGVDANGDGIADPYNPADAIFTAARYLHAAGASKNLSQAIYAYNHAGWYVQSVMLRAELIGGMPKQFINAMTGLVEGHFPVAAPAKYADDAVLKLAKTRVKTANAAVTVKSEPEHERHRDLRRPELAGDRGQRRQDRQDRPEQAARPLRRAPGRHRQHIHVREPGLDPDALPGAQARQKVSATSIAKALLAPAAPAPSRPPAPAPSSRRRRRARPRRPRRPRAPGLAAGDRRRAPPSRPAPPRRRPARRPSRPRWSRSGCSPTPTRPTSYAAGGKLQITPERPADLELPGLLLRRAAPGQEPVHARSRSRPGSVVVAGTILGRLGAGTPTNASHLEFMIQPAGKNAPYIDPKPILDGWKLLEATAVYRAAGVDPFFGPGAKNPTIGQILLMSKEQLQNRVLADPNVQIYACGRRDIQAGAIDRRILAVIEFLSASGLKPDVTGLKCGNTPTGSNGIDPAGATGASVDISAINGIPIQGHQGPGSITDITIRRLLTLQGAMQPDEIVSLMSYKGQPTAIDLSDHANRIQITYTQLYGKNKKLGRGRGSILQPSQWTQLINRISQISEPIVPISPSKYAIKTGAQ